MEFITYIIYCIASVFTTAYAGGSSASLFDLLVGMLCLFIFLGIFACVTFIICHFRKKKQKTDNKESKVSEEKESPVLFKTLPAKQKKDGKDFIK
ncbi:MAG: hypothetical protein K2O28_03990 [Clostridia bacterium]|nr:hypothetical protein [Clostridia bacterium]